MGGTAAIDSWQSPLPGYPLNIILFRSCQKMFRAGKRVTCRETERRGIIVASRAAPSLTGQCLVNLVKVYWDGALEEVLAESLIVEGKDDAPN